MYQVPDTYDIDTHTTNMKSMLNPPSATWDKTRPRGLISCLGDIFNFLPVVYDS